MDATSGAAIVEDTHVGGDAESYPQEYKSTIKSMAKEMNVKGKNLFHPVRLALTGEMSGQDVTKQLSLLAMAEREGSVDNGPPITALDIRVGQITKVWSHEESEKLCSRRPRLRPPRRMIRWILTRWILTTVRRSPRSTYALVGSRRSGPTRSPRSYSARKSTSARVSRA